MISAPGNKTCQQTWDKLNQVKKKINLDESCAQLCKLQFQSRKDISAEIKITLLTLVTDSILGYHEAAIISELEVSYSRLKSWYARSAGGTIR